jgi:hypothetical protein
MFFFFGVGLILIDEVIKRFRPCFYASSFSAYQRIYDHESMASVTNKKVICAAGYRKFKMGSFSNK